MTLRTVRVPPQMAPLFEKAERVVSTYFEGRRERPDEGTIEIFEERYVLVRGASLSVEFFGVTRDLLGPGREGEADEFSRNILFDVAHAMGKSDARKFHEKMGLVDPIEKLSAGPVHFAHAGWAFVDLAPECRPGSEEDFFFLYDHPYSFESDAWVKAGKHTDFPVCIMNAGYSSGWCEESFGIDLVASELLCRARGDECCRFVMAHPREIERHLAAYLKSAPDVQKRVGSYKIPDFFARKRLDDELKSTHEELKKAHEELEGRVEARTRQLREANENLAREIQEKNALEQQLLQKQKLEALGRLAGGIAHDFNNILTVINGCAEALVDDASEPEARRLAQEILKAGERAARLTGQLLVFGRQRVSNRDVVDVGLVVQNMSEMLIRLLGADIRMVMNLPTPGTALLRCSASQMEQVVLNLVINARDAMSSGGHIELAVAVMEAHEVDPHKKSSVRLTISDSGEGMTEEVRAQLFDPFFTTKKPGKGTGLGLSTVYGIVQQAEGTISVESELGRGSKFTLTFPHAGSFEQDEATLQHEVEPTRIAGTILLVEDEVSVRQLLQINLVKAGYDVVCANDGVAGLAVFKSRPRDFDLLLTDVVMPGMSGVDMARSVREMRPNIPIVFLSGYAEDRVSDMDLENFGATFLSKPVKLAKLRAILGEMIASHPRDAG